MWQKYFWWEWGHFHDYPLCPRSSVCNNICICIINVFIILLPARIFHFILPSSKKCKIISSKYYISENRKSPFNHSSYTYKLVDILQGEIFYGYRNSDFKYLCVQNIVFDILFVPYVEIKMFLQTKTLRVKSTKYRKIKVVDVQEKLSKKQLSRVSLGFL